MPFFRKRSDKTFISIVINSISYEKNPDTPFQIECGLKKKEKHHATMIPSSTMLTNKINHTFNFIIEFKRNQNKTWQKKYMKFAIRSYVEGKLTDIAKWNKDLSILSNKQSIQTILSKNTSTFGRVDLDLTINKGHSQRKKISESNNNQIHFERNSEAQNPTRQLAPRLSFAQLIVQDCQFFSQSEPEFINQSPLFTLNIISHCATNISQINIEFLVFQFRGAFSAIKNLSEEIDLYAIISIFHFVSSFIKRQWATSVLVENFTDFLNLYFIDLVNRMKDRFDEEILEDCYSPVVPNIICQWLIKRGRGPLCQVVFTGILLLFSASYGKSICQILASSFCIRERIFKSLIDELPEGNNLEVPFINGTIYAILIQLGVNIG